MNELIFFIQSFLIVIFALIARRIGNSALTAWIAVQALIANIFVMKQVSIFGFEVTAADVFAVGSLLGLNLMQEYFGEKEARRSVWICFFFMAFFALISQLHLLYVPTTSDYTQQAFQTILSPSPRLFISSLLVFFLVQQFDIRFFSLLKKYFPATNFALRTAICLAISQLLDTLLFSVFGLYGIVNSLIDIIIFSFLIKLIIIAFMTPIVRLAKT